MSKETEYFQAAPAIAEFQAESGGIGHSIVVINESATNAAQATAYVDSEFCSSVAALPGLRIVPISRKNPFEADELQDDLADGKSHAIFVFGGDSTVRAVAEAIHGTHNVLWPSVGGNAGNAYPTFSAPVTKHRHT